MPEEEVMGTPPDKDIPDVNVEPGLEPIGEEPAEEPKSQEEPKPEEKPAEEEQPTEENPSVVAPEDKTARFKKRYDAVLTIAKNYIPPHLHTKFKQDVNEETFAEKETAQLDTPEFIGEMKTDDFAKLIDRQLERKLSDREARSQAQQVAKEIAECDASLREFVQEGSFTQEDLQAASNAVAGMGFTLGEANRPGDYARVTQLIAKELNYLKLQKGITEEIAKGQIDAAKQDENLLNTKQPPGGAMPEQPPLSDQQKILKDIQGLRPNKLSDLIDK